MLVDGHAHVSDMEYGRVETLLAQLDQAGVERVLCVPGGTIDVAQFTRYLTGQLRPKQEIPNHLVYEAISRYPDRCYGLVCINPHTGAAALNMMRDGFAHGCRGMKLSPMTHQFKFSEPVLMDVAAACGERGFPVYTHVLPSPGSTTADFAALARRCPKTNFILGHMGFGPGDADAIDFCAEMDNFYLETSCGNYLIIHNALKKAGPRKLIFGSEFPLCHPKAELENLRLLDPSAHEAVCGGNILRLIGAAPAA